MARGVEGVLPNYGTKALLFLSSYAPLLVILGIRDSFGHNRTSILLFALAAVSVATLLIYLTIAKSFGRYPFTVQEAFSRDSEAMSYVVTYLLPFLGLDPGNTGDRISLGIFLLVLAALYISSNLIHMNPMLSLLGYRIFEVESTNGKRCILLTRRAYISPGTDIEVVDLSETIVMEKRNAAS